MKIEGILQHQDIEGGFWGIIADDGAKYVPVEPLADEWLREGLHVTADVRPANVLGTTMWGTYVFIDDIQQAD